MIQKRFIIGFAFLIGSVHWLLSLSHDPYAQASQDTYSLLAEKWKTVKSSNSSRLGGLDYLREAFADVEPTVTTTPGSCSTPWMGMAPTTRRANATLMMLARNSEIYDVISSVKSMEDRFNRRYKYPWVFLNDEDFTEEFKNRITNLTDAKVEFGKIPHEHWQQPPHIDESRAMIARAQMVAQNVLYGGSISYRNMCRFNSGFFYRHELLQPYRYYWRVEPNVKFFCDLQTDPFVFMEDHNKTYSFTIALEELPQTVRSLWTEVKSFMEQNPEHIAPDNGMPFISHDNGATFNMCHFWSNFEIADLNFWRSPAYQAFFEHLDAAGGFYYERWGDAPVHSIAAAILLPKERLHFFNEIGYRHEPFQHCPQGDLHIQGRCSCNPGDNFDYQGYASCMDSWDELWDPRTKQALETKADLDNRLETDKTYQELKDSLAANAPRNP